MNFSFVHLIEFEPTQNFSLHKYLLVINTIAHLCNGWKKGWDFWFNFFIY